ALVVLVVVAGVLFVMAINKSAETGNNTTTPEGQNTQNMPYSQDSNSYTTSSPSSGGSNSQEVK
ncbi:MAG: hypothetical protein ABFC91_03845, partial [Methanobacteriaceae archaeon]